LGGSFGKLSGATFRNNCFEEQQVSGIFGAIYKQLRGAAFSSNFRSSFREPLCRIALGTRFEV
jgi:hypothetical protein